MSLAERIRRVLQLGGNGWALEFEGTTFSWSQIEALADAIGDAVRLAGAKDHDVIGWAAENLPGAIAGMAGLAMHEHCAALINPHIPAKILAREIREQRFPVILGSSHFWSFEGLIEAAREVGTAGLLVSLDANGGTVVPIEGLEKVGPGPHRDPMPDYVVERLSSGTTGPPKRSPQSEEAILKALQVGQRSDKPEEEDLRIKSSPSIVFRPLAHAGSFSTLLALWSARPIALQQKFSIEHTIGAVQRHRPKVIQLVPAMIRMIWDADVPRDALSSLIAVRSGTAPLDPVLQADFEEKYGIPILIDYGATEFGGAACWTLGDHRQFAAAKRGSVGRPVPGARLRVVDQESGVEITDGRMGILEVNIEGKTEGWISTTDLAAIDGDGFLFIRGRADDAIVRGGFKVLPDDVARVLRQHPLVGDVAVVGVDDHRLGQVPVAVVETRPGQPAPDAAELEQLARDNLTPYQVPAAFRFTDKLPRTPSLKIIRAEVLEMAKG
ncbi:Acyl-CoA synthetase (AMP-forming)/AMP-acid ligase II [Novosphingobium sp. CF614]|uniref:class I adenylate-forming enzyme family protein n=1 Tax=Novosphingobium sp. CF614 TaxID=1884364 RepID=UPI0008DF9648|nr:class I adenylate-forming enzyme family protein [Novosphingobium sp. CF614]SFF96265.1 Acyl-CoA synthetase (AMP-forming)/AMP-acid ligase II [Novosphingobium sp. CF614]